MPNRVFINAPIGVIELEGEKEFVEAQIDKLLLLVEAAGFGTRGELAGSEDGMEQSADSSAGAPVPAPSEGQKRTRRTASRPPKGHSCADRILVLRQDGFFKQQRTTSEIVEGLGGKGWTHSSNQVAAAAGQMFNRGEIQRAKAGRGFAYFWDRE